MTSRLATSTLPRRRRSARSSPNSAANPATSRRIGSSGCPPKRSGNTPAGPGRRRPPRSATSSAANRRTSRGSRTTGPSRGRRSIGPPKSAVTPPTPGGCTTCTATSSSGAGIGTTRRLPGGTDPDLYSAKSLGHEKRTRRHLPGAPGRVLGRRRLALPVRLSIAVRTGAALRPHRLSRRRRAAVGQENRRNWNEQLRQVYHGATPLWCARAQSRTMRVRMARLLAGKRPCYRLRGWQRRFP